MDTRDIRVKKLRSAVGASTAEFARKYDLDATYLSQLLNGHRGFGEKAARKMEAQMGKPPGWFDIDDSSTVVELRAAEKAAEAYSDSVFVNRVSGVHARAGSGEVVYDFEELEHSHSFKREWMQREGLDPRHCKLVETKGMSMFPTIDEGELLLVNLRDREPRHNKIFVLVDDEGIRVKRLIKRSDGEWEIHSDNQSKHLYPTEPFVPGKVAIWGRVRWHAGTL